MKILFKYIQKISVYQVNGKCEALQIRESLNCFLALYLHSSLLDKQKDPGGEQGTRQVIVSLIQHQGAGGVVLAFKVGTENMYQQSCNGKSIDDQTIFQLEFFFMEHISDKHIE